MEFILVHKPVGILPPEQAKMNLQKAKEIGADPQAFVQGGKVVASYYAIGAQAVYCIWDVPNAEALAPFLLTMSIAGWNTEVIPAEKAEVAIGNIEKAMAAMQAQPVGS